MSVRTYLKEVFFPCVILFVVATGAALIPFYLMSDGIIRFLCIGTLSSIVYAVLIWFILFNAREKQALSSFITLIKDSFLQKKRKNSNDGI